MPNSGNGANPNGANEQQGFRWLWPSIVLVIIGVLVLSMVFQHSTAKSLKYSQFLSDASHHQITNATFDSGNGVITGQLTNGTQFTAQGPNPVLPNDIAAIRKDGVEVNFSQQTTNFLSFIFPYLLIGLLFFGILWFVTLALGVEFLIGTGMEWHRLIYQVGLTIRTNLFGTTYYSLVGLHAVHVTIGSLAIALVMTLTLMGAVTHEHAERIEMLSWYWHFVDAVWIVVFLIVYVIGAR